MSDDRDVAVRPGFVIPHSELSYIFDTSGGPGGQHANRTQSVVTLRWDPAASRAGSAGQRERIVNKLGLVELIEGSSRSSVPQSSAGQSSTCRCRVRSAGHPRGQAPHVPYASKFSPPTRG